MEKRVHELIAGYEEDFVRTLRRWIQVPSVKSEAEDGAPFGKEIRRMLDLAVETGKAMGFRTAEYDGYACDMTLGEGEEEMAVLGHLDVVPAGDGWTFPPFGGVVENGRIYGRGTSDDKGPSLAAMYAMKAIREAGIPLKRKIRLILGCDEESGWEDMAYYAEHAKMPEMGFSPDASFPLINTEKGMLHLSLQAPESKSGLRILSMSTGERLNVIPGESRAVVRGGEALAAQVRAYAERTGLPYSAEVRGDEVELTALGIPGHSAYPEGRRNAIGMMLKLLAELGADGPVATLAEAVGTESDGRGLGCACADEISGPLTANMGILRLENGEWYATLDFRCPVSADLDALEAAATAHLPGFRVNVLGKTPAHHVPAESDLVRELLAAYTEETGQPGEAEATGGGTYAKVLRQGVAYGSTFADEKDLAHQADEYKDIASLMLAAKIYANALIRMCT